MQDKIFFQLRHVQLDYICGCLIWGKSKLVTLDTDVVGQFWFATIPTFLILISLFTPTRRLCSVWSRQKLCNQ